MDHFELLEKVGKGAFAVVWRALRKKDNRVVAIKQLNTDYTLAECARMPEILALQKLGKSEFVVGLEQVFVLRKTPFLVFEYYQSNLFEATSSRQKKGSSLDASEIRWVCRSLLSALAHVHGMGFCHRDIKPENLLLGLRGGEVRLCLADFGQARRFEYTHGTNGMTAYVGTRWYRAPEMLLQARRYNVSVPLCHLSSE
jgi:protein kinase